ncbi:hypothetical protein WMY93_022119 [Mugilogobius chulae]|uniref:Tetraspanin n=1 Tax=Mugilogobius chulae TaxID=88201 RepID=A0AAW0NMK9_9GOBI
MGKINGCLKCLFIFFNVLFAIIGCLLFYGAVKASSVGGQFSAVGGPGMGWVWVFAIGVLGISILASMPDAPKMLWPLKSFQKQAQRTVHRCYIRSIEDPNGGGRFQRNADQLQSSVKCCGLSSAEDWGSDIPQSCSCDGSSSGGFGGYGGFGSFQSRGCKSRPQGTTGPSQIYAATCGEFIFSIADIVLKIFMGFCFGVLSQHCWGCW